MTTFYGTLVPTADQFVSLSQHASAVLGDRVYIDGGQLLYNKQGGTANPVLEFVNLTLALDFSTSWDNQTVIFQSLPRGGTPFTNGASLWPNAEGDALYRYGGALPFQIAWPSTSAPPGTLWKLTPDQHGTGSWTQEQPSSGFPASVVPMSGLSASGNGLGFYLGGTLSYETYPQMNYGTQIALSGLIEFNSSSGSWQNLTSTEVSSAGDASQAGQAAYGGAHFVPTFGPEGIAVFFGNTPPLPGPQQNISTPGHMNAVSIFEPVSQTWYNQTAHGPSVPSWRGNFCTTGVAGDNGTYEIVIHAGTQYVENGALNTSLPISAFESMIDSELALDQIYVLSLPSFAWFQAQYAPMMSRSSHTCHTVGSGRQLLTIGGMSFNQIDVQSQYATQDVFAQGLGIFDLTDLQWMPSYNATAASYVTPAMIKNYIAAAGPTPTTWDDPRLAQVFATTRATNGVVSVNPSLVPGPASAPKSSSSAGAIAGGVVGGLVALCLLVGLGFFLLRRSRTKRQRVPTASPVDSSYQDHKYPGDISHERQEVEGYNMHELPVINVKHEVMGDGRRVHSHEMPVSQNAVELEALNPYER